MLEEVKRGVVRRKKDQRIKECERKKVEGLLVEYQSVFSTREFDIGRTTFVKHCIAAHIKKRKNEEGVEEQTRRRRVRKRGLRNKQGRH